jgi:ribosomal protein L32
MGLKDFTVMGTCPHCGEYTKLFPYKNGFRCQPGIDFDKACIHSKARDSQRRTHDSQVRKAIG